MRMKPAWDRTFLQTRPRPANLLPVSPGAAADSGEVASMLVACSLDADMKTSIRCQWATYVAWPTKGHGLPEAVRWLQTPYAPFMSAANFRLLISAFTRINSAGSFKDQYLLTSLRMVRLEEGLTAPHLPPSMRRIGVRFTNLALVLAFAAHHGQQLTLRAMLFCRNPRFPAFHDQVPVALQKENLANSASMHDLCHQKKPHQAPRRFWT